MFYRYFSTSCYTTPWTPVPITGEIFGVLIAGLILGKRYGALSQILYILLGISIIPWFTGMSGGIEVLLGANGGYLIGFIFLSYFIKDLSKISVIGTTIAYFTCIYIPGLIGLAIYFYFNQGILLSISQLLMMGLIPFIIGDIIKIIAASSLAKVFKI
ncbi:MAG: biotin transporter BioY [archaeon]|nr:biotin transporter BioY [archaeon]